MDSADADITNVLRVERRYNGPPDSGNGGVTCGLLAIHVDSPVVQVTLRIPPPLDTDLIVRGTSLYDGDTLVAEAVPGTITVTAPPSVGLDRAAASVFAGTTGHPFPGCFVCGPEHPDGLRLFAGPVGEDLVATTWTPTDSSDVMVWAALDCPGGWSADLPGRPMVLGRMTCRIDTLPVPGEAYVVQGWLRGGEGRKVLTGSALYDAAGEVLAVAEATWITLT